MNGMYAAAASASTAARIDARVSMADSLRGLPDRALQGSIQSCGEERGEALLEQARVVAVLGRHLRQRALERRLVALHGRGVQVADQGADRFRRLGIGAPEEANEIAPAPLGVLDHAQPRADEGANDALRS